MAYASILRSYLDCFSSCGSLDLIGPLLPTFRSGQKHRYYSWIVSALKRFSSSIVDDSTAITPDAEYLVSAVCNLCFDTLISDERGTVKRVFMDSICVPLLNRVPEPLLVRLMSSSTGLASIGTSLTAQPVISRCITIVQNSAPRPLVIGNEDDLSTFFAVIEYCYVILTVVYNRSVLSDADAI